MQENQNNPQEDENSIPLPTDIPEEGMVTEDGYRVFPDGSAVVEQPVEKPKPTSERAATNLAMKLSDAELKRIGLALKQSIEEDSDSQKEYLESVSNAINLLGIKAIRSAEAGLNSGKMYNKNNVFSSALFETLMPTYSNKTKDLIKN